MATVRRTSPSSPRVLGSTVSVRPWTPTACPRRAVGRRGGSARSSGTAPSTTSTRHTPSKSSKPWPSPKVYRELDPAGLYGVWWYKRREARTVRVPLGDGHYRKGKQIRKRPKDEWLPVPGPASGVRLKTLVQVRRLLDGASQVLRGSDAFLGTLRASCAAQTADEGSSRSPRGRVNEEGRDP
jgi:hypothetical protein